MRSQFRHLQLSDRVVISNMLNDNKTKSEIATALGFNKSTICREIKRNSFLNIYDSHKAQYNYKLQRKYCVYYKTWNPEIFKYIIKQLKNNISPDAIAGRLIYHKDKEMKVSHQTIYNWIINNRLGSSLQKHLLYGKKGYKRSVNTIKSLKNQIKKRIDEMPQAAIAGYSLGHFQGDSIVGAKHKGAIASFVDIKSKYILADKMEDRTASSFSKCMKFLFSDIDNDKLKTILQDNGSEMSNFKTDEQMLNCKIYFTYPGRPWEKALVENSNRLIRRFFPKKTKFANITRNDVLQATKWINNLPRKSLKYRTAYEVFHNITQVAFEV